MEKGPVPLHLVADDTCKLAGSDSAGDEILLEAGGSYAQFVRLEQQPRSAVQYKSYTTRMRLKSDSLSVISNLYHIHERLHPVSACSLRPSSF